MGSLSQFRKTPHQKCFGVEIECYPLKHTDYGHLGFFYVTDDGSLGYDGKEFISQPLPINMLNVQIKKLHKQVGGWRVDHSCGLHVHVARELWSLEREEKFTAFICTLSETQITELFGRFSNYARPKAAMWDKYRAINLQHSASYEFRLWKAGDLTWTLEALRRTQLIVQHKGKWTYEKCLDLFTQPV